MCRDDEVNAADRACIWCHLLASMGPHVCAHAMSGRLFAMPLHLRKVLIYGLVGAASNYVFAVGGAVLPEWQDDVERWVQSLANWLRGSYTVRGCSVSGMKPDRRSIVVIEKSTRWMTTQCFQNFYAFDAVRNLNRLSPSEQFIEIGAEIDRQGAHDLAATFAHVRQGPDQWVFAVSRSSFGWPCRSLYSDSWITVSPDAYECSEHQRYSANMGPLFGLRAADVPYKPMVGGFGANTIFWGSAFACVTFAARRSRQLIRTWRNPAACSNCGYDTRSLATNLCPECGAAFAVARA